MHTFDSLPLQVKVEIIVKDGIHLGTSLATIYQADLYAVGKELVEVLLLPQTCDFVHIRMAREAELEKYTPSVKQLSLA